MVSFKHTRTTGKKLSYDITVHPNRYVVSLDGKVLKDWSRPVLYATDATMTEDDATAVFAINDIEQLIGMDEE